MNNMLITGNVCADPQQYTTKNNNILTAVTIASREGWGDGEQTLFYKCKIWSPTLGNRVHKHFAKGSYVVATGKLSTEEYEGKTNLILTVNSMDFGEFGGKKKEEEAPPPPPTQEQAQEDDDDDWDDEDSIPF